MEHLKRIEDAKKTLKVADHLLTMTYGFVNDPKMFILVAQKLYFTLQNTMSAILHYELYYKRIPPFREDFDSMFDLFKARCTRRYNINVEYINLIHDIKAIIRQHEKSPVEFVKDKKLVICSDSYATTTITKDNIKSYIEKAKLFIREAENMISKAR